MKVIKKKLLFFKTKQKQMKIPTNIYLFKFNNRNTRRGCEICSELTIKTTK